MKQIITFFFAFSLLFSSQVFSQGEDAVVKKYLAIQGLGYLHTQVALLIKNWEIHPLNHAALDEHEHEFQKHLLEELEHDEEWAEYMMVEENLVFSEEGLILDVDVQDALDDNLEFYHRVIKSLRTPDTFNIEQFEGELELASERLYNVVFPAIIR
ncbi:MAG: hypothetical protein H6581_01350 [Bacteroidia bacterium]|nr:hypothetical protein [Bacteroidia bacterium]